MSRSVRVCSVDDIAPDSAQRFDVEGHRIAIVRIGDDLYAIGDRCSHADYSLAEGEIDADDCTIECWKHGSAFSLTSGEPATLPATRSVPVYTITILDDNVHVTVEKKRS